MNRTTAGAAVGNSRRPDVEEQLEILQERLNQLDSSAQDLCHRLAKVLSEERPKSEGGQGETARRERAAYTIGCQPLAAAPACRIDDPLSAGYP